MNSSAEMGGLKPNYIRNIGNRCQNGSLFMQIQKIHSARDITVSLIVHKNEEKNEENEQKTNLYVFSENAQPGYHFEVP